MGFLSARVSLKTPQDGSDCTSLFCSLSKGYEQAESNDVISGFPNSGADGRVRAESTRHGSNSSQEQSGSFSDNCIDNDWSMGCFPISTRMLSMKMKRNLRECSMVFRRWKGPRRGVGKGDGDERDRDDHALFDYLINPIL